MLGRIKARVPGSTINDVTLAYVGGALREYLNRHDELPDQTLVAACPISLRDTGDTGRWREHVVRQTPTTGDDHR